MHNSRFRVRGLLVGVLLCLSFVAHAFVGQSNGQGTRPPDSRSPDITAANATGDAAGEGFHARLFIDPDEATLTDVLDGVFGGDLHAANVAGKPSKKS